MNEATCSVEGCEADAFSRGWCPKHYQRWKKHGDPLAVGASGRPRGPAKVKRPRQSPIERLMQRRFEVDLGYVTPCWYADYAINKKIGYAVIGGTDDKTLYAHIVSYVHFKGEIPEGLQLDHLCHSAAIATCPGGATCPHRRCWNPDHLEPATQRENIARGMSPGARSVRTGLCGRGHLLTDVYVRKSTGYPTCATCQKARSYAWYHNVSFEDALRLYEGGES